MGDEEIKHLVKEVQSYKEVPETAVTMKLPFLILLFISALTFLLGMGIANRIAIGTQQGVVDSVMKEMKEFKTEIKTEMGTMRVTIDAIRTDQIRRQALEGRRQ